MFNVIQYFINYPVILYPLSNYRLISHRECTDNVFLRDGPSADNRYSPSCYSHRCHIRSHHVLETQKQKTRLS